MLKMKIGDEDEEEIDLISSPSFLGAFAPGKHFSAYYERPLLHLTQAADIQDIAHLFNLVTDPLKLPQVANIHS